MLALKLLWRNWRSGEVRLLAGAILIAVAVVSSVAIFTDRLDRTLVRESNMLLGADAIVRGSHPHATEWDALADERGIRTAQVKVFASMVYAGDEMYLASIKAADANYPLRGSLDISQRAFAIDPADIESVNRVPASGEVWIDSRLFPLLDIALGDTLTLGEKDFRVTEVLVREPDSGNPFSFMGARVLINLADLEATDVVQPGSLVDYQWLLAGEAGSMASFIDTIKPELGDHQRLVDAGSANRGLGRTLSTGKQFLMLSAVIGVLLAGVAIALAAQQFSARHVDQVALMKSLGMSARGVRWLYSQQLLILAVLAAVPGLLIGQLIQQSVAWGLQSAFHVALVSPGIYPYAISFGAGLICLICFAMPALWFLPGIPPIRILRRDLPINNTQTGWRIAMAAVAIVVLVLLFSRNITLALSVVSGMAAIVCVAWGVSAAVLRLGNRLTARQGSIWRLARGNIQRRKAHTLIQMVVFSTALMLVLVLIIVRTSLLDEWQTQMPDDAPNHFLVNVAPHDVAPIQQLIDDRHYPREQLYPMVRGRLTHINEAPVTEAQRAANGIFNREVNLTWTDTLASDNRIVDGHWWKTWQGSAQGRVGVSVEAELAREVGLKIGDHLGFSLGGLSMEAEIASLRTLDWRSMKPNFFFIFEPGALDDYSPTFMTSLFLPREDKVFINDLLRQYPTILIVELDRLMEQIRTVVNHVSEGVQLVLWLIMLASAMVLFAAVTSSLDSRKQETGLLRALGSSRRLIMGSIWAEFTLTGFLSGAVAIIGAELLLVSLQHYVLEMPVRPHYLYWIISPVAGALLVGGLGAWGCRGVVNTPPAIVLREAS